MFVFESAKQVLALRDGLDAARASGGGAAAPRAQHLAGSGFGRAAQQSGSSVVRFDGHASVGTMESGGEASVAEPDVAGGVTAPDGGRDGGGGPSGEHSATPGGGARRAGSDGGGPTRGDLQLLEQEKALLRDERDALAAAKEKAERGAAREREAAREAAQEAASDEEQLLTLRLLALREHVELRRKLAAGKDKKKVSWDLSLPRAAVVPAVLEHAGVTTGGSSE